MTMQAALSSVNFGLKSKPSAEKNALARLRSRTARLTKILRPELLFMVPSIAGHLSERWLRRLERTGCRCDALSAGDKARWRGISPVNRRRSDLAPRSSGRCRPRVLTGMGYAALHGDRPRAVPRSSTRWPAPVVGRPVQGRRL